MSDRPPTPYNDSFVQQEHELFVPMVEQLQRNLEQAITLAYQFKTEKRYADVAGLYHEVHAGMMQFIETTARGAMVYEAIADGAELTAPSERQLITEV